MLIILIFNYYYKAKHLEIEHNFDSYQTLDKSILILQYRIKSDSLFKNYINTITLKSNENDN